jgi:hypothetical protein
LVALEEILGCEIEAAVLQDMMQRLGGIPFDLQLARERLLLRDMLVGRANIEHFRSIVFERHCSWTLHGAAAAAATSVNVDAKDRARPGDDEGMQRVSEERFRAWVRVLCERRLLDPSDWPKVREWLARPARRAVQAATGAAAGPSRKTQSRAACVPVRSDVSVRQDSPL